MGGYSVINHGQDCIHGKDGEEKVGKWFILLLVRSVQQFHVHHGKQEYGLRY